MSLYSSHTEPQDCYEVLHSYNQTTSGKYWIYPVVTGSGSPARMQVWCDMDTDGGGWTVSHIFLSQPPAITPDLKYPLKIMFELLTP